MLQMGPKMTNVSEIGSAFTMVSFAVTYGKHHRAFFLWGQAESTIRMNITLDFLLMDEVSVKCTVEFWC